MQYRQIVIDTETTGIARKKHRVLELGCVELDRYKRTGKTWEWRFKVPLDTFMEPKALEVHGITIESLQDERTFQECLPEILEVLSKCDLIGFNTNFDINFLDMEFAKLDMSKYTTDRVFSVEKWARIDPRRRSDIDTRAMMKERWKDKSWSLNVLCKLLNVSASSRQEHGALLDAQLTAECYIRMMRGGTEDMFKKEEWKMPEIRRLNRTDPSQDDYIGPLKIVRASEDEVNEEIEYMMFLAENYGKDISKTIRRH